MNTEKEATKKRRGTSLPLIVGFLIFGVVGYFFGEKIMTYVFYLQKGFIATSGAKGGDAPANTKPDTSGDPNIKQGRLVMCEHGDRRLSVLTKGGGKMTIADRYQGKRLNSPNDAVLKSNGDIYFTDPPYGLPQRFEDPMRELDFCGVYRVAVDGTV